MQRGEADVDLAAQAVAGSNPQTDAVVLIDGVPLSDATPPTIDGKLAEILYARYRAEDDVERKVESIHRAVGDRKTYPRWAGRRGEWSMRDAEAIEKAAEIAALPEDQLDRDTRNTAELYGRYLDDVQTVADLDAQAALLEDEFTTRGGWSRAYLVDNASEGHVHSSMHCSTCNNGESRTRFHWVTDMSGHAESEIVDAAGESACTTCYPSAPVDTLKRPSRIEGPNQKAAREAAEQRATEKRTRDAAKVAKAIANPDGSPLRVGSYGPIATESTAQQELVRIIADHRAFGYRPHQEDQDVLFAALAAKRGVTVDELRPAIEEKVKAKIKRDARG